MAISKIRRKIEKTYHAGSTMTPKYAKMVLNAHDAPFSWMQVMDFGPDENDDCDIRFLSLHLRSRGRERFFKSARLQ